MTREQLYQALDVDAENFTAPCKDTCKIFSTMPNELYYLDPCERIYHDKVIPTAYNLVNNTGSKVAVHVYAYCSSCQHKGRVMATQKREASMADIIKGTGLSKRSVINALNVLSDIGYMRAYKDAQDSRIQHYRINPVYWDISKAREIDWIDWILFADVLMPYLDEETIKNLNNMAYTQWIRNYSR